MTSIPRPKPWESSQNTNAYQGEPFEQGSNDPQQPNDQRVDNIDSGLIANNNNNNDNNGVSQPPPVPGYSPGSMMNTPYYRGSNYGLNQQSSIGYGLGSSYGLGGSYGYNMNSTYGMNNGIGSYLNNHSYPGYGYNNGYMGSRENINGDPNGGLAESTRATFQLLENLVGTINGFAQMLESSYMATYNSFFTLISFAEEVTKLKDILGGMFGVFNVIKLFRKVLKRRNINSQRSIRDGESPLVGEFGHFTRTGETPKKRRSMSLKPLIVFFLAVFGFPYVLNKLIKRVHDINSPKKQGLSENYEGVIDPSKLEFARAIYDFVPENPKIEITLKKGDLMAIISKTDPFGKPSQWWNVRTKGGSMGYIPFNYVEIIKRQKKIEHINEPKDHSLQDSSIEPEVTNNKNS
ncbi:similar to Saccharomyces cerevisiae YLR191W PEX13 Integral peroxisomal membrane protein required for translocation of peroxisomal matrix proteins [Maudiozyma barnettii]|uniref:Peroxisomal membrane protein PEX13 n=1 Tax=Maudiozyma barnettii TaxID=61262 RepID=A0A8H2VET6_9SACH|nr:peroxin PEX13 [Kazachstania barnettii]CAB4253813.1 similar to Saccharomyces cerevisiae YLR191W PEX13 Integral peroxisomal membrane protein required for translocation of peroxisomal matrix proteins [Kazachstania barnettii]CAD1781562.1 similar to Saccharomyces cerevisiae YLR191W PEX13 Integral peroxisomal membrane protein required for translocation of peroxisomal matrix proteins [Kazachstania barnettii]